MSNWHVFHNKKSLTKAAPRKFHTKRRPLWWIDQMMLWFAAVHYNNIIMSAVASQITKSPLFAQLLVQGRSKKTSKLRVTGLCAGNSPVTGEFLAQKASNAENVCIWWHHHASNILQHFDIMHTDDRQTTSVTYLGWHDTNLVCQGYLVSVCWD